MKIIIAAIAAAIAVPAAAQTAPAPQAQHQGHGQHQGHDQHQQGQHGQHQPGQHQGHGDCCADRNGNGRMDCCENMAAPAGAQPQGHDGH